MFLFMFVALVLLMTSCVLSSVLFGLGNLVMKKMLADRELQSPFECGFSTFSEFRLSFSVHFFLVALVFVIFDVELIILFPFITTSSCLSSPMSEFMFMITLILLTYGLLNEWNQSILEWAK